MLPPSSPLQISIVPIQNADISFCASLAARAFHTDRHTRVKQLGKTPYDLEAIFRDMLTGSLESSHQTYVKAVADNDEGDEIVGWCGWGFREGDNRQNNGNIAAGDRDAAPLEADKGGNEGPSGDTTKVLDATEQDESVSPSDSDPLSRLHALESSSMRTWSARLMPPDISCMYFLALIVVPHAQRRGVGTALVEHVLRVADEKCIFTWVHASEQAWGLLQRHGFEEVGRLEVDLDRYAPRGPSGEEERECGVEERWRVYVLRYGKRVAREG